jgi:ribulose-phosphate 3-epimerase
MIARPVGGERALAIVPSMLDVDFAHLAAEAAELEAAGADRLQWDVMDGHFVPKLTHGGDLLARTRAYTRLPFEAHLMVDQPEDLWQGLAQAGADLLIVHAETTAHLHLLLSDIRQSGHAAGVALNPATPLATVAHVLDLLDLLLIMTVNPGRGGQAFIHASLDKVTEARKLLDRAGSAADLEVDGGVSVALAPEVVRRGVNVLVAGSAVHRHPGGRAAAISELRQAAKQGLVCTGPGSVVPVTAGRQ